MPKRPIPGLLLAVLVVALVGCAKEVKPPQQIGPRSSTASATATPSVTPSATATPWTTPALAKPTLPEIANLDTGAGAEAFTRYWYDQLNYAVATGDTSGLMELSHPKCVECLKLIEDINSVYRSGGHQEGNAFEISIVTARSTGKNGIVVVEIIESKDASTEVDSNGNMQTEAPASQRNMSVISQFIDERWYVLGLAKR